MIVNLALLPFAVAPFFDPVGHNFGIRWISIVLMFTLFVTLYKYKKRVPVRNIVAVCFLIIIMPAHGLLMTFINGGIITSDFHDTSYLAFSLLFFASLPIIFVTHIYEKYFKLLLYISIVASLLSITLYFFSNTNNFDFISNYLTKKSIAIIRNLTTEINQLVNNVLIPLMILLSELILVLALSLIFLYLYPLAALFLASMLMLPVLAFRFVIKNKISVWGEQRMGFDHKIIKKISEGLSGFVDLKVYQLQSVFTEDYTQNLRASTDIEAKQYFFSQVPRISLDTFFVLVVLAGFLLNDIVNSQADIFSAFALLILIGIRVLPSIGRLAHCFQALKYGDHVVKIFLDINKKETVRRLPLKNWSTINVCNVSKNIAGKPIIDNFSLEIERGDKVLITGVSGSGKTTLINMLCGLLPLTKGHITIGGRDLCYEDDSWFQEIAFVKQQSYIIDANLIDNIKIVSKEYDHQRLQEIITFLELEELLDHVTLGENGVLISGGQRQRVSIARALYKRASCIFMDEPTSALNDALSNKILDYIVNDSNLTVVCISHNLDWVSSFDKHVVLG